MENLSFQEKIEFILENKESVLSIAKTLVESDNIKIRKDIIKLLSALASTSAVGRTRVLECFSEWKEKKKFRYRFQPLVRELEICQNVDYASDLVRLINSMISSCDMGTEDRIRMRNELLGLKLHSTLDKLRALPSNSNNFELMKQLDTFDERKKADEEHDQTNGNSGDGVDLNSHVDIFYAILKQVSNTPHEILFLNILQHLLQIDSREAVSDYVWESAEKLVCRAKLLESKEDALKLLRQHNAGTAMIEKFHGESRCYCLCHRNGEIVEKPEEKSLKEKLPPKPPPLPPPLFLRKITRNSPTKDTNFAELISQAAKINSAPRKFAINEKEHVVDKQPPANHTNALNLITDNKTAQTPLLVSPQINPLSIGLKPKQKLKTFAWNKVPIAKVVSNRDNIWIKAARNFDGEFSLDVDVLEELFCQSSPPNTMERKTSSPSVASSGSERKKRDSNEINLLDPKRSLNVNIFLRQFRGDINDLMELIESINGAKIGLEKLRSLMKIMPELDEIESLTSYSEDKSRLGSAEKFFMALIDIPHYRLRVESMLLKEEFSTQVEYIRPSVDVIILAAKDLKNNSSLHDVMYLVLMVGNYLNSGSYGGNAVGFKMTSLWKLVEIRANKPNVNLLHFVVMEVEKKNSSLLEFSKQMKYLEEVSKLPVETIASDFRMLKDKTARISKHLENAECTELIKQMNDFLEYAKNQLIAIDHQMREMEKLRLDLAVFFCEDPQTFKLEDCFKIFYNFCIQFNKAIEENNERKIREEKSEMRKKQLKEQQKSKAKENIVAAICRTNIIDEDIKSKSDLSAISIAQDVTLMFEKHSVTSKFATSKHDGAIESLPTSLVDEEQSSKVFEESKFFRRTSSSRRRFTTALNDVMSTNDRDRPVKPWRDRLEELLKKEEQTFNTVTSSVSLDSSKSPTRQRRSLDLTSNTPQKESSSSTSSFTECSPIFAKTFGPGRIEVARISSVSDLRQRPTLVGTGFDVGDTKLDHLLKRDYEYRPPVFRRLARDKRSQSLHVSLNNSTGNRGDCVNDLTELLQTLETEKKLNDLGRRQQKRIIRRRTNESGFATDGDVGDQKSWRENFRNGQKYDSNNSLIFTKSTDSIVKVTDDEMNMKENLNKFVPNETKKDINENKIEPIEAQSAMDLDDLADKTIVQSSIMQTDSTNPSCSSFAQMTMSQDDPTIVDLNSNDDRPLSLKLRPKLKVWPSPHSYSDQSDARSTESPTESVGERDEGFETESHSTACSEQHSQLSPNLEPIATQLSSVTGDSLPKSKTDSASNLKQRTSPGFMSLTKSAAAKNSPNGGKPQPAQITVKSAIGASGNFVKRMIESISNKKPAKTFPVKTDAAQNKNQNKICTDQVVSLHKPVTTLRYHSLRETNAACASNSSSSSLSASPVRKPSTANVGTQRQAKPAEKINNSTGKSSTPSMTPATKQRLTQMRSRLKASKETASSSDSDKGPPPRRIPPRTLKSLAAKSNSSAKSAAVERKLSVPDKTWQRLMSPPKTTKTFSDLDQQRNRAQSLSSGSNYATAQNARSSPGSEKMSSNSVVKKKVWR